MTNKDKSYETIRRWGRHMGSMSYYIVEEIQRAKDTNAPPHAIYRKYEPDGSGWAGKWAVAEDISDPGLRAQILEGL
jgi:hypothetical protein